MHLELIISEVQVGCGGCTVEEVRKYKLLTGRGPVKVPGLAKTEQAAAQKSPLEAT